MACTALQRHQLTCKRVYMTGTSRHNWNHALRPRDSAGRGSAQSALRTGSGRITCLHARAYLPYKGISLLANVCIWRAHLCTALQRYQFSLRICVCGVQCSAKVHVYLEAFVYGVHSSAKASAYLQTCVYGWHISALLCKGPSSP